MLDLGARCEYYGVKRFRSERSYVGVPNECEVIATYARSSPSLDGPKPAGSAAHTGRSGHLYASTHWTTAFRIVSRRYDLDEERLLETVISRWLGPIRRPTRLFPWFTEEFPGADPTEGLNLLPEAVIEAVRHDSSLPAADAPRSNRSNNSNGSVPPRPTPLTAAARLETARLLGRMRSAWLRGEWLIAIEEQSRERLISFRDVRFEQGTTVKPTDSTRLYMHNYGHAVLLSETMREHVGFSAAAWLIWADAPDPFSGESLAECAPERALRYVNDDLIRRIEGAEAAPALGGELRAELTRWLRALVDGWKRGYWVTFSV